MDELLLSRFGAVRVSVRAERVSVSACVYRRVTPPPRQFVNVCLIFNHLRRGRGPVSI